jgi:hypothetical protein
MVEADVFYYLVYKGRIGQVNGGPGVGRFGYPEDG